ATVYALIILARIAQAQQKELHTTQLNVFREDPATVVGRLKGFFAAEGLEVKVSRTANSTDQMRGLSNGTYHIASTSFDNVLGWSGREGADLIAVAQIIDKDVVAVFVRREVNQWSELRGQELEVDVVDTALSLL